MEKIYANQGAYLTKNKELIKTFKSLNSNSLFADTELFKRELFDLSSAIREDLGINNVISFSYDEDEDVIIIATYGIESVIGATYTHGFDEKGFYILTDRQGVEANEPPSP